IDAGDGHPARRGEPADGRQPRRHRRPERIARVAHAGGTPRRVERAANPRPVRLPEGGRAAGPTPGEVMRQPARLSERGFYRLLKRRGMTMHVTRRGFVLAGAAALSATAVPAADGPKPGPWAPKLSENLADINPETLRWLGQLGCKHVIFQGTDGVDA